MDLISILSKIKKPEVLKESNNKEVLQKLKDLTEKVVDEDKDKLLKNIKYLESGIYGEDQILYELKNSGIPMYILHDLYFEVDDLSAQIDFIVITKRFVYVIESKNLKGNIFINNQGDFISKLYNKSIYNPITQNNRHLNIIKKLRTKDLGIIGKYRIESAFDDNYTSLVVFTNKDNYIDDRYAKKEVRNSYVKIDRLVEYIKKKDSKEEKFFYDKGMLDLANFLIENSKDNSDLYLNKYKLKDNNITSENLQNELKEWRKKKATLENMPAYYIFDDKTLNELVTNRPKSNEELDKIVGFGEVKIEKYGKEVIEIINK